MDRKRIRLVALVAALVAAAFLGVWLGGALSVWRTPSVVAQPRPQPTATQTPARTDDDDKAQGRTQPVAPAPTDAPNDGSVFTRIFGAEANGANEHPHESLLLVAGRILFRLALAALLVAMLAYRPRRDLPVLQRNPFVAQTQILMAVIASALMMIVGDSAARAFGIFAAASLVRFRTNIQDPKEITVLLLSLSIGLATGTGHWELALLLALFMFALLWLLEYYEPAQVTRPMELSVTTRRIDRTQAILKRLFRRHRFNAEVRQLDRESEDSPLGRIVYLVNVSASVSTDLLSSEILAAGSEDIDAIEWQQSKGVSYIFK
jgi:uncharacterized membrane protein YhiD involved in acid resistance